MEKDPEVITVIETGDKDVTFYMFKKVEKNRAVFVSFAVTKYSK
jgi:hypothetical protein